MKRFGAVVTFLSRNGHPHHRLDPTTDPEARALDCRAFGGQAGASADVSGSRPSPG